MPNPGSPLRFSWMSSQRPVPRLIARPLRRFLHTEAAGGMVLLAATLLALILANSPWSDGFESLWKTEISIDIGNFHLAEDLRHWVNDGLMAIFFFVVGLEIKRELAVGELNDRKKAMLPALAALGGMVVPAAIYWALNAGGEGGAGWGIPMATDIAFAVGVLALLSDRVPTGLKVFLLSLAIVDDIGAILVIAIFYTESIHFTWLLASIASLGFVVVLRTVRVWWTPVYVVVGTFAWLAMLESGVHATIAGVALGLLTPARSLDPRGIKDIYEAAAEIETEPDAETVRRSIMQANEVVSVAERLEHLLHPWTSYVVIPIFALANAGIVLSSESISNAFGSSVTWGIILGLIVGKIVGITGMSMLAVKTRVATLPAGVNLRHVTGGAAVAGIGFTVSLFIAGLAFSDADLIESAKIGIFVASIAAGGIGAALLLAGKKQPKETPEEPV